eukprot:681309-Rhodomonas_salina.1
MDWGRARPRLSGWFRGPGHWRSPVSLRTKMRAVRGPTRTRRAAQPPHSDTQCRSSIRMSKPYASSCQPSQQQKQSPSQYRAVVVPVPLSTDGPYHSHTPPYALARRSTRQASSLLARAQTWYSPSSTEPSNLRFSAATSAQLRARLSKQNPSRPRVTMTSCPSARRSSPLPPRAVSAGLAPQDKRATA